VQWSRPFRYNVHVIAVGTRTHTVREAYCDDKGNFCARYLPHDDYSLWAHDYDAGWCAMPAVSIRNDTADVGSHRLAAGGTISGTVPPRLEEDRNAAVVATDSHGVAIESPGEPIGKSFAISGLWPGKWTVRLSKRDERIAEKTVVLAGTETVSCDFAGRP
jgi:hypothetical protein